MHITVDLEEDVLKAAQSRAEQHRTSLDSVLSELLRKGLGVQPPVQAGQRRFTFSLPGGAVTAEDVRAALEENDVTGSVPES